MAGSRGGPGPGRVAAVGSGARSGDVDRRAAGLAALAAVLVVAFVVAPPLVTARGADADLGARRGLVRALRGGFVEFWTAGDGRVPADLARVVDYWQRYHLVKAVIAAALLAVLAALGARLRTASRRPGRGPAATAGLVAAWGTVLSLGLFALLVVMANVQGALAPLSSLLPMLTAGSVGGQLAGSLDQVRHALAASTAGSPAGPALDVLVGDFRWYHVVMAVMAAGLAVAFAVVAGRVVTGRWGVPRQQRVGRRAAVWSGVAAAVLASVMVVLAVANTTAATDSSAALLAFFRGGW